MEYGFFYAQYSNLSGDPCTDAPVILYHPESVVEEGEVFFVRDRPPVLRKGSEEVILEPVGRGSYTRFLPSRVLSGVLLEPASTWLVRAALKQDLANANEEIVDEIRAFIEEDMLSG